MVARDISIRIAPCALVLAGVAAPVAAETLHHELQVALDPAAHEIRVSDRITLLPSCSRPTLQIFGSCFTAT